MSTELVPVQPASVSATRQPSMLEIIGRAATDPTVDVSKMERLLAVAEQIHAREAKAAYDQALNDAQGEMRPISRDCHNPQTRSKYASYEAIDTAIRPIYTAHGFAMSFGSKAAGSADRVVVTCRISHRGGHTENVELEMPCDGKGAKGGEVMTRVHATGSALSYAKRYIANLVWNLSFGEHDDDGNAAGSSRTRQNRQTTSTPHPTQQNAPQTNAGGKKEHSGASSADVLPQPKVATEKTRTWALDGLREIENNPEGIQAWLKVKGWWKDDQWDINHVPTSKEALAALQSEFGRWLEGEEPANMNGNSDLPEDIASVVITVPRKGMTRKVYFEKPDTIGSLREAGKTDEYCRGRLWGLCENWKPEPFRGNPPSQEDLDCRAGLDAYMRWHEEKENVGVTP